MTSPITPDLSRATWRKSSHSGGGNDCVEIARVQGVLAVRDSKNPDGPKLSFRRAAFRTLVDQVKAGGHAL